MHQGRKVHDYSQNARLDPRRAEGLRREGYKGLLYHGVYIIFFTTSNKV
jgi:hypothetical protein